MASRVQQLNFKKIISNCSKPNKVDNPNWQKANQLAIYKDSQGVQLRTLLKQHQLVVRVELKPTISRLISNLTPYQLGHSDSL